MKVLERLTGLEKLFKRGAIVSIGNFDGLHLGHRTILRRNIALAKRFDLDSVIITFEPHPMSYFNPANRLRRIYTAKDKIRAIAQFAPDFLLIIPFKQEIAQLTAEQFIQRILLQTIKMKVLLIGANFALGKKRQGTIENLKMISENHKFRLLRCASRKFKGELISSSRIRAAILRGDLESATSMLGQPFTLEGEVIKGRQIGSKYGIPTINLAKEDQLWPADGVYACQVEVEKNNYLAAVNLGVSPTFGINERRLEAHLLDFSGDLYGQRAKISFWRKLRNEQRFNQPKQLYRQIDQDIEQVRNFFNQS